VLKEKKAGRAMDINLNTSPGGMSLEALAHRSVLEMRKFRRKEPCDDQYCMELFRRALVQQDEEAWSIVYGQWQESVRHWFRCDASRPVALRHEDEQNYIDDTFKRFWQSVKTQQLEFSSLASALRYLRLCLNSVIIDTLRTYARKNVQGLPEPGAQDDLVVEDSYHEGEWWSVIESILTDPRERRAIYLLYHCGLKPKEIVQRCPGEFADEQEIYRLRRNGLERLRRNSDKLLHKLGWQLDD
jgi:DNA-directed RNA polymerase specialized sigma24 family protein